MRGAFLLIRIYNSGFCTVACGIAAEPFKTCTRQGRRRKNALELLRCHLHPAFGRVSQRIEQRIERRRPVLRSTPVVGAAALAAVAPEDPTVETDRRRCGALNRMARYAATGIDGMIFAHRMRGAAIDAPAACTAPAVAERRVVTVAGRGENQLASIRFTGTNTGPHPIPISSLAKHDREKLLERAIMPAPTDDIRVDSPISSLGDTRSDIIPATSCISA